MGRHSAVPESDEGRRILWSPRPPIGATGLALFPHPDQQGVVGMGRSGGKLWRPSSAIVAEKRRGPGALREGEGGYISKFWKRKAEWERTRIFLHDL